MCSCIWHWWKIGLSRSNPALFFLALDPRLDLPIADMAGLELARAARLAAGGSNLALCDIRVVSRDLGKLENQRRARLRQCSLNSRKSVQHKR